MTDLKRQNNSLRTRIEAQDRYIADLEQTLGEIAPEYAAAYAAICDLAIHGLRRPDDLGQPINSNHAESRAPAYHAKAYHIRNEERRWQRIRATRLRQIVEGIDGHQNHPPVVGPTNHTQTPQPSQNGSSPSTQYATVRLTVRRAPQ